MTTRLTMKTKPQVLCTFLLIALRLVATADPVITVFTNRAAFEAATGPVLVADDFANNPPLLSVTTANGVIRHGLWADIARDPEPSTVWELPFASRAWGGTWDLTVAGTGGGLAFELEFPGFGIVSVPTHIAPGTEAGVFFGFSADQPFTRVRVRQFDSHGNTTQETHSFDDMAFSMTAPSGEVALHDGPTTAAPEITDGQAAAVNFGTVAHGTTATRTFTLANPGAVSLSVHRLRTGGKFQIVNAPATPFTLAAGASATFDVSFSSVSGGTFTGRVDVLNSDADEALLDFPVTGSVPVITEISMTNTQNNASVTSGQAEVIEVEPNPFGGGSSVSLTLGNPGLDPLTITGVILPPGFEFTLADSSILPQSIAPGGTAAFVVTSTGPTAGVYQGQVHLLNNDSDESDFQFPIRALFNMPEMQVLLNFGQDLASGATVDFGTTLLGQQRGVSLVVKNLHAGPLTVTGITLPAGFAPGQFAPAFPFTLTKNQTREIPVVLAAQTPGNFTGTASIANNDFDEGSFLLQFTGTVSPESMTFFGFSTSINEGGSVSAFAFGSGTVLYEWDFDNDGQFDDATGSDVPLLASDGPGSFLARVRMTDDLTSMIRTETIPVLNITPSPVISAAGDITTGQSLALGVQAFDAAMDLAAGVQWRIDWGDGNVQTTGTGQPAATTFQHAYAEAGRAYDIEVTVTDKDNASGVSSFQVWVHSAVIGVFDGPDTSGEQLRDGLSTLNFSSTLGVPVERTLTLLNRSAAPAAIGPVSIPAGFQIVAAPAFPHTLVPGGAVTLTVRFMAASFGTTDGILQLGTPDPLMPVFDLALSGFVESPDITIDESSAEISDLENGFGVFTINPGTGNFDGVSLEVSNDNPSVPLTITAVQLPLGFRLAASAPALPLTLDNTGSSSASLRIQCEGAAPGFYDGWVRIVSNDPDENPFRFFVRSRVGNVPDLIVLTAEGASDFQSFGSSASAAGALLHGQTAPLTFAARHTADPATTRALMLHNQGNQPLTVSTISLPAGFAFASAPEFPLNVAASAAVPLPDILYQAAAPGTHGGTLSITSTDPDENPYTFPLSGTVTAPSVEPVILSHQFPPGSGVAVTCTGPPGKTCILQRSTNLQTWQAVDSAVVPSSGTVSLADAEAVTPRVFYRVTVLQE